MNIRRKGYYEIFYNISKAYDSSNHELIEMTLKEIETPRKLIKVIENLMSKWKIKLYMIYRNMK